MKKRKQTASLLLALVMACSTTLSAMPAWASDWKESLQAETPPPLLLEENFDGSSLTEALTTYGNAQVKDGALVLDGSTGTYAELDGSILAGKDSLTVSMDLTTEMTNQLFSPLPSVTVPPITPSSASGSRRPPSTSPTAATKMRIKPTIPPPSPCWARPKTSS